MDASADSGRAALWLVGALFRELFARKVLTPEDLVGIAEQYGRLAEESPPTDAADIRLAVNCMLDFARDGTISPPRE